MHLKIEVNRLKDKKVLNRLVIVITLVFAVSCIGLLVDILYDMQEQIANINQEVEDSPVYTIWIPSTIEEEVVKSMYTSYDEKKLGVKFQITTFSVEQYEDLLITSSITNELPDMFYVSDKSYLKKLVDMGAIMDLDEYITRKDITKDFVEGAIADFTVNNKIYGLPLMGWEEVLYCNKAIFEACNIEYPTNYEEFKNCIRDMKRCSIIPLAFGGQSFRSSQWYYRMLVEETGSLQEGAKAVEEIVKLSPFQIAYEKMEEEDAVKAFINGESAMFLGTSYDATKIEHSRDSRIKGGVEALPCPTINEKKIRIGSYGSGFVLNKGSKLNKEEKMKDFYESFERRLSWEMVSARGKGLPVYKAQNLEQSRFKLLSRCDEFMIINNHEGVYETLLREYERQGEMKQYKLQILRLIHGQIDAEAFLSALRL